MIYLKNTIDTQDIYIPRLSIVTPIAPKPTYEQGKEDGYKLGYGNGIEDQKDQLLNLYVTENGVYEREDGYGKVTVIVDEGGTDCKEAIEDAYEDGYKEGYKEGAESTQIDLENKSIDIVSNGEYTVTPTDGFDALESVKISVDVPNGGKCNLEDKIVAPQTNEVDSYGYIYFRPNEGYDGMLEVAMQTSDLKSGWYNEGYEEGKSQGGECNIQADKFLQPQLSEIEEGYLYVLPDEGYIGMSRTVIQTNDLREGWYNEGYDQGKAEGGNCNLSHQLEVIGTNGRHIFYPQNNGWDGFDLFEVEVEVPTTAKLQDVWVTPSMADRDDNNLLVYSPNTDEGYDGLSRVVIDPQTIYNEGYNEGINSCAVDYPYTHLSFYTFRGDLFEIYKNSFDFTDCFTNANDEYIPNEDFMIMLTDGFPSKISVRCKQYIKGCYKMPIDDNLYGFDEVLFNNLEEVYFTDYGDNDTTTLTFMEVGDLRMSYITFRNLLRIYADVNSFYISGCDLGTNRENGECTLYPLNENAKEMINSLSSEWVLDTTSKIILK